MPELKLFLDALPTNNIPVIQTACMAAELAILKAKHDLHDAAAEFVVERTPACCLLYGFVAFRNGHLSKLQFFDLVRRVESEGYLPGHLWFVSESPETCRARLQLRASLETDPTAKAQRVAEASAPMEYLRDIFEAHCLFYANNLALQRRVQVVGEALPVRVNVGEYNVLVQRVFGARLAEYFDGLRRSATLGSSDSHDGAAITAAAASVPLGAAAAGTATPPP